MNVHYTVCCHWINETESGQETVNNLLMTCFLFAFNSQVSYISQDCEEIPEFLGRKYGHMAKRLDLSFNLLRYVVMFRFFKCTTGHPLQSWIFFFFFLKIEAYIYVSYIQLLYQLYCFINVCLLFFGTQVTR